MKLQLSTRASIPVLQLPVNVKRLPDIPFHGSMFCLPEGSFSGPVFLNLWSLEMLQACHACDRIAAKGLWLEDPTSAGSCQFVHKEAARSPTTPMPRGKIHESCIFHAKEHSKRNKAKNIQIRLIPNNKRRQQWKSEEAKPKAPRSWWDASAET